MSQERIDDSADTPWWGEHEHRYDVAMTYISPGSKTILDIACGSGFGTFKLYNEGKNAATGGDVSDNALQYCRAKYSNFLKQDSLEFRHLDATALDIPDQSVDVIVSFETLEHIDDYKKVVEEFKRALKHDGVLLLSTPNRTVSSPTGKIVNPYHIREFTVDELSKILSASFSDCRIGGQQYVRYRNDPKRIAHLTERIFYLRGVRRLSVGFRDAVMRWFGLPRFYPIPDDYRITWTPDEVEECLTLFAVCRK